ncbi:MarR family winged helix-turn-helix transcriptional regulator [Kitasatospora sp. NBC_01266]|uniref:MarR family winged helix-turn-helix transcriptional regulator n=1 Tax=Kitasatospora sp. NBC_01266 TaxID=2903572 RepID=UPI002E34D13A|nr:MarR family transcriptional regulator [Kitasatospora sp. NBC_01266]
MNADEYPTLGMNLRRAHGRAAQAFAAELEPLGIENRLAGILMQLGRHGPQTQRQLMLRVSSDKSSMVRSVDDLEARGLAARTPHPTDRRAHAVAITPAGEALLTRILLAAERVEQQLLSCLEPDEQRLLGTLLERFAQGQGQRQGQPPVQQPLPCDGTTA